MPVPIVMPTLGMTMREGRVVEWAVGPGTPVAKGQIVLRIETEKSEVELEAPVAGVLRHVYVDAGTTVPCGTLLAALTDAPDDAFDAEAFRHGLAGVPPADPGGVPARTAGRPPAPRAATPAARVRARDLGVDPGAVPGTGPGGRVTREDVEAFAAGRAAGAAVSGGARSATRVTASGGVVLEVLREGAGDPVLLLPGFGTDLSVFARQTPVLARHASLIGLNPRGVAGSDAPDEARYDVPTLAADAAAVLAAPAHVVGASLGAAVAVELALTRPERVRSLSLITPFVEVRPRLEAVLDAWCRVAHDAPPETLARTLAPWLFSQQLLADRALRERTVRGLAAIVARVPPATLDRTAAGLRAWSGSRRADLRALRVPTLVVAAAGDLLAPDGVAIADAVPGSARVVVPNAGHALTLEAADAVNEALLLHVGSAR